MATPCQSPLVVAFQPPRMEEMGTEAVAMALDAGLVAKPGAVAPFCSSDKALGEYRHAQKQPDLIASWRRRSCPLFVSRGASAPGLEPQDMRRATTPLTSQARIDLIGDLAQAFGRPVDLIDLTLTHSPLLQQILTQGHQGQLIFCKDRTQYAELIRRMVYEEADFMPYYRRILAARRKAWIGT